MSFISVEGLDGSGKSTVIKAIEEEYPNAVTTAEPSELWTGRAVRRCLQDNDLHPLVDFYFFMGDRVNHIEETVRPFDEEGYLVISDRYADSTRAYQPVALGASEHFESSTDAKIFIEETMRPWDYPPDQTIYIDISVDTALHRCDESEKYEKEAFLEQVQANYNELIEMEPERFIVIDGEQPKDVVAREAVSKLDLPPLDRI